MEIKEIPIDNTFKNDKFNIVLGDTEFILYIKYNSRFDYYTWDIYSKDNIPLLTGQRMIADFCLNHRFKDLRLPKCRIFGVNIADDGQDINKSTLGKTVRVAYELI